MENWYTRRNTEHCNNVAVTINDINQMKSNMTLKHPMPCSGKDVYYV